MSYKYDLVIVGGGNGGMMAACRASAMGLKTLVIERHNMVGGAAASFVRGRFEFEASLHELTDFGHGEHRGDLGKLFDELGIETDFLPVKDAFRVVVADGKNVTLDATVPHGKEEFYKAMEEQCPGCTPALDRFFDAAHQTLKGMEYYGMCRGNPDPEVLRRDYPTFCRVMTLSMGEFLRIIEMPQKCIDIIGAYWPYQGCDLDTIDASRYLFMCEGYFLHGAYLPRMRSHEIANALHKRARELGCDIWLETEVTKIRTKKGAICGVETKDGRVVDSVAVIANTFPEVVYGKLLDDKSLVPAFERKKIKARKYGFRGYSVYLGLDASPEELGIKDYNVFLYSTADTKKLFDYSKKIQPYGDNIAITCLNIVNPDASPKGTTHLAMVTGYTEEAWGDVTPENYVEFKRKTAEAMIKRYEEAMGIEISSHIEEISVATPITFARYMYTPQGTIYGYMSSRWDGMSTRLFVGASEPTIPGLWFVGAHGTSLSGYKPTLSSGDTAAKQAMGYIMGGGKK